jgi:acylphosphatase
LLERRHVYYSGYVHGVGFRYRAQRLADAVGVAGFVKNLPDGRVEVVVEGEGAAVEEYLSGLREKMRGYVEGVEDREEPPTGEFSTFEIAYDRG